MGGTHGATVRSTEFEQQPGTRHRISLKIQPVVACPGIVSDVHTALGRVALGAINHGASDGQPQKEQDNRDISLGDSFAATLNLRGNLCSSSSSTT